MILYNDYVKLIEGTGSGEYDDYGRPKAKERISEAHVRYKLDVIYNSKGEKITSKAQVYIPFTDDINPITYAPRVLLVRPTGESELGKAISVHYGQDVSGKTKFLKVFL